MSNSTHNRSFWRRVFPGMKMKQKANKNNNVPDQWLAVTCWQTGAACWMQWGHQQRHSWRYWLYSRATTLTVVGSCCGVQPQSPRASALGHRTATKVLVHDVHDQWLVPTYVVSCPPTRCRFYATHLLSQRCRLELKSRLERAVDLTVTLPALPSEQSSH